MSELSSVKGVFHFCVSAIVRMMLEALCSQVVHLSFNLCVCVPLWTWYFNNHLAEFHQIYDLGALGDNDELVNFWGQKAKRPKVKVTIDQR